MVIQENQSNEELECRVKDSKCMHGWVQRAETKLQPKILNPVADIIPKNKHISVTSPGCPKATFKKKAAI